MKGGSSMQLQSSLNVDELQASLINNEGTPAAVPSASSATLAGTAETLARKQLHRYIRLQLITLGMEEHPDDVTHFEHGLARSVLANIRQKTRLLKDYRCPADTAI